MCEDKTESALIVGACLGLAALFVALALLAKLLS